MSVAASRPIFFFSAEEHCGSAVMMLLWGTETNELDETDTFTYIPPSSEITSWPALGGSVAADEGEP